MPLTFSSKGTSTFKQCKPGTHLAVCDMIVFLGLQPGFGQYPDPKQQVYVRFAIPAIRVDYEKDGKKLSGPQVIGKKYTASMHKKATLRLMLESWRGRKFTEQEACEFDISKVLNVPAMVGVIENESGGNIYSNIGTVSGLPAGVPAPKLDSPVVLYTGESPEDVKLLPEWLQKLVSGQLKPDYINPTGCYADAQESGEYDFAQPAAPIEAYEGAYQATDDDLPAMDDTTPF